MPSKRSSGLLLHVTSLPGAYGIGDLGPAAYRFVDFLAQARQRTWQILPLGPVGHGASPYSSLSTFAGNPLLVSPERLVEGGLLDEEDLAQAPRFPTERVDFERVIPFRRALLTKAFERFEASSAPAEYERFRTRNAGWLEDYALYMALKEEHGGAAWTSWEEGLVARDPDALERARERHHRAVRKHMVWQYLFDQQWAALKRHCHDRQVQLFGDLPIYVAHDSADVWANQDLFYLDATTGRPTVVAGVPPDYFSETGQRWGNPLYRWNRMRERGYTWWKQRFQALLRRVDLARLDHFRGFEAYWEIPAEEETAVNGRWVEGPGADLFEALRGELALLPLVAEDLGTITPEVRALMEQFALPGMAVLVFGFDGGPSSEYLPHHYRRRLVAYTTTHDNNTLLGWWETPDATQAAKEAARARAFAAEYLGVSSEADDRHWTAVRTVMASVAERAIFPLQDVLGLGSTARMNTPGRAGGNWTWRCPPEGLAEPVATRLAALTELYDRTGLVQEATANA